MRALVVGLGRMGTFHARVLADLGYEVTTVDPEPAKGADHRALAGKVNGVPAQRFDVACIAVPIPHLLRTAAEVATRFPVEHLLIEKPMAPSAKEWLKFGPCLHGHVQNVAVGYVERFNPVVRRLIRENRGRTLECIEFTRLNDRPSPDARLDLWSHDLDLAMWLRERGVRFEGARFEANGDAPRRTRVVRASYTDGSVAEYDLTAHTGNPLRRQWEAFLEGDGTLATPADAIRVLDTIEGTETLGRAA